MLPIGKARFRNFQYKAVDLQPNISTHQCVHNWRKTHRAYRNSFANPIPDFEKKKQTANHWNSSRWLKKLEERFWGFKVWLLISFIIGNSKIRNQYPFRNPYYSLKSTSSPPNKQHLIIKFYLKLILFRFFISRILQVVDHCWASFISRKPVRKDETQPEIFEISTSTLWDYDSRTTRCWKISLERSGCGPIVSRVLNFKSILIR